MDPSLKTVVWIVSSIDWRSEPAASWQLTDDHRLAMGLGTMMDSHRTPTFELLCPRHGMKKNNRVQELPPCLGLCFFAGVARRMRHPVHQKTPQCRYNKLYSAWTQFWLPAGGGGSSKTASRRFEASSKLAFRTAWLSWSRSITSLKVEQADILLWAYLLSIPWVHVN